MELYRGLGDDDGMSNLKLNKIYESVGHIEEAYVSM